jgi:hypothetical protein
MQSSLITPRCPPVRLPQHRFADDQLNLKLLDIALTELPKAKPLRRSQLARRDYVPEPPAVLPAPPKSLCKGLLRVLLRMVRSVVILIIVGLILFGAKSAHDWFSQHYWYGVLKTGVSSAEAAEALADGGPTHLGERTLLALPNGRRVQTVFKGILPTEAFLPKTGNHEGDMWSVGYNYWIWTGGLTGTQALQWTDP